MMNVRIDEEKHKLKQYHLIQCANIINRSNRRLDVCGYVDPTPEKSIPHMQRAIKAVLSLSFYPTINNKTISI